MNNLTRQNKLKIYASLVILLGILGLVDYRVLKLVDARTRDTNRIEDMNNMKNLILTKVDASNKIPPTGYQNMAKDLAGITNKIPTDPVSDKEFKYYYLSKGQSFALCAKMESASNKAKNDGGIYNAKPLYYEIGYGSNWQQLIPKNLP